MGYQTTGSYATVQETGPNTLVDVLRISFYTTPSRVTATANVPYKDLVGFTSADADTAASIFIGPLADGIERMMGSGRVSGAVGTLDVGAGGQLVDYIDATVEYDPADPQRPGPFQSVVRIPVFAFDEPSFYAPLVGDKVNAAYDALVKLAGG